MAKYTGSFISGLAGGLKTGLNYGMNAAQIRWQVDQKKKLEKEKEKMQEVWTNFSQSAQEVYESGGMSQETERKLYALLFTLPPELQASANNLLTSVNQNDKAGAEKEFNNLQMVMEVLESTGGRITDEALDGLINILNPENQQKITAVMDAYKSVPEQPEDIWGQAGKLPQDIRPEYLRGQGVPGIPEATTPETEKAPTAIEQKIAGIDKLEKAGIITKERANESRAKIYGGVMPEETAAGTEPTPEDEITAGQKRKIDVEKGYRETAKEILYGERDYMGMPISIGIIPMDMQMNIATGKELTNEEKQTILNNYNLRKDTFNKTVKTYLESILKQLGVMTIPEEKPTPEPTPEPEPKKTGVIQSIKDWWKGTPQETTPKTETDYWTEKYGF